MTDNALMRQRSAYPMADEPHVVDRGFLLPLGTYSDGTTRAAWPGLLAEPVMAWNRLMQRGYQPGQQDYEGVQDAFAAAGGAMTGGLFAPRPNGSFGVGGRYRMLGYRGQKNPGKNSAPSGTHLADDLGIWFGDRPDIANSYAMQSTQNNPPWRQAMELDRRARFEKSARNGFKDWDRDLETLVAMEMDEKAGRTVHGLDGANVARSMLLFDNPKVVDYGGRLWSGIRGQNTTSLAADAWKAGHDALIVKNAIDYGDLAWLPPHGSGRPGTSIAVRHGSQIRPWYDTVDGEWFKP